MKLINYLKRRVRTWLCDIVQVEAEVAVDRALDRDAQDVKRQIVRIARDDSAEWLKANVPLSLLRTDRYELMSTCAPLAASSGLILEFGVWTGKSVRYLSSLFPSRVIYGFDSFEGLNEPWITSPVSVFDMQGKLPEVPANVTLVKG
jgi:hypothetical protein